MPRSHCRTSLFLTFIQICHHGFISQLKELLADNIKSHQDFKQLGSTRPTAAGLDPSACGARYTWGLNKVLAFTSHVFSTFKFFVFLTFLLSGFLTLTFGSFWQHLATFANFYQILPTVANFGQLLGGIIMSPCHPVIFSSCNLAILSFCHFVIVSSCPFVLLSV